VTSKIGLREASDVMPPARDRETVVAFRAAVSAQDFEQLRHLADADPVAGFLQEAGECLLALIEEEPASTKPAAELLATRLQARSWPGDAELAQLLVAPANGATGARRRIRADLDSVADILDGSEFGWGGVLDAETGAAWPEEALADWAQDGDAPDPDSDPQRYLPIPTEGSRGAWEDMRDFAMTVDDEGLRERLLDAIDGKGAFARFQRVLNERENISRAWYSYAAECRVGRAREWLATEGYDVLPPLM
jgi:Uncharacterised protein family (UPF0158)